MNNKGQRANPSIHAEGVLSLALLQARQEASATHQPLIRSNLPLAERKVSTFSCDSTAARSVVCRRGTMEWQVGPVSTSSDALPPRARNLHQTTLMYAWREPEAAAAVCYTLTVCAASSAARSRARAAAGEAVVASQRTNQQRRRVGRCATARSSSGGRCSEQSHCSWPGCGRQARAGQGAAGALLPGGLVLRSGAAHVGHTATAALAGTWHTWVNRR